MLLETGQHQRVCAVLIVVALVVPGVLLASGIAFGYYNWTRLNLRQDVQSLARDGLRNIVYAGCANGTVYENHFDGSPWSVTGLAGGGSNSVYSLICDAAHQKLYAGSANGLVYLKTGGGGFVGTTPSPTSASVRCMAFGEGSYLYAGCSDGYV